MFSIFKEGNGVVNQFYVIGGGGLHLLKNVSSAIKLIEI
jgi:hypothetical protein